MSKRVVLIFRDGVWVPEYQYNDMLGETFWEKLGGAFMDPEKKFEFPIKPFEMDLTQSSKNSMYIAAGIIGFGLVMVAVKISKLS